MEHLKGKHFLGKLSRNGDKKGCRNCSAYLTWELSEDGRFSASGEVWNHIKTDITMGGQCVDTLCALFPHDKKAQRILAIWEAWHLNDMRAGCVHQRAAKWDERPIDPTKPTNAYGKHYPGQTQDSWNMLAWVRRDEHPEGLLSYPCPECGYKYGSEWLKDEIPADVIAEIISWVPVSPVVA